MNLYKMAFLRLLLILTIAAMLVGCGLTDPPKDDSLPIQAENKDFAPLIRGSFSIGKVEGSSSINPQPFREIQSIWGFSESVLFNYTICVKNIKNNEAIQGHKFEIQTLRSRNITVSDSEGCLSFRETLSYKLFADPHYLEWPVTITARGLHQGSATIYLAILPWNQARELKLNDVLHLHTQRPGFFVPADEAEIALAGNYQRKDWLQLRNHHLLPRMDIEDLKVTIIERPPQAHGIDMELEMTGKANLKLRKTQGQEQTIGLQKGLLKVRAFLIGATEDKQGDIQRFLLNPSTLKQSNVDLSPIENGILMVKNKISVEKLPKFGRLELILQVESQGLVDPATDENSHFRRLQTFYKHYVLGDVRRYTQGYHAKLQFDEKELNAITQKLLQNPPANQTRSAEDVSTNKGDRRQLGGYFFEVLRLKYGGVARDDETATTSTAKVLVTSCIRDLLLYQPVRQRKFIVKALPTQVVDSKSQVFSTVEPQEIDLSTQPEYQATLETDESGCIRWTDRVHVADWYQPESFRQRKFIIEDAETHVTQTLTAVINPWNTGWLFARDSREVSHEDLHSITDEVPRLQITSYNLNQQKTSYEVDSMLDLTLKREYYFRLMPQVVRHDSLSYGRFGKHPLKDGYYKLHILLARQFDEPVLSPESYVNNWKQVVKVDGGIIATTIELSLSELILMSTRNRFFIHIEPINEEQIIYKDNGHEIDHAKTLRQPLITRHPKDSKMPLSQLVTPTFESSLTLSYETSASTFVPVDRFDIDEFVQRGIKYKNNRYQLYSDHHDLKFFDREYRLETLYLNDIEQIKSIFSANQEKADLLRQYFLNKMDYFAEESATKYQLEFCRYWETIFLPNAVKRLLQQTPDLQQQFEQSPVEQYRLQQALRILGRNCREQIHGGGSFFKFDQKYISHKVKKDSTMNMGGVSFNYNVRSDFFVGKDESWDIRQGHRSDVGFSAGVGLKTGLFDIGAKRSESWDASEGHGYSMRKGSGFGIGAGTYLVMQHSRFRFWLEDYERCVIMKPVGPKADQALKDVLDNNRAPRWQPYQWPPSLTDNPSASQAREKLKARLKTDLYLNLLESGLRVCEGELRHDLPILEDYFYITQHFVEGHLQDSKDRRNLPWLIQIRGMRDFKVFIESLENQNSLEQTADDSALLPIKVLKASYSDYNARLPSWPRVYSPIEFDPFSDQTCNKETSFLDQLASNVKEAILGPLQMKDGKAGLFNINFWEIYYCGQQI